MRTPWGPSQNVTTLERGVYVVDTASHGGIIVEKPDTHGLSERSKSIGHTWSNGLAFEEDCAVNAVFVDRLDLYRKYLERLCRKNVDDTTDEELRSRTRDRVAHWYPDHFDG